MPKTKLPSAWDIGCSNHAGKEDSEYEEGWGNNSKSWDSLYDKLMNRVEHNSELIRLLSHKIEELTELVLKLIKDVSPSLPKE